MTTTATDKIAEKPHDKRRALGRGLESLLPGPRVVAGPPRSEATGEQQIPRFARNDKTVGADQPEVAVAGELRSPGQASVSTVGPATAVREQAGVSETPTPRAHDAREMGQPAGELRSTVPFDSAQGRQPGAAVPTHAIETEVIEIQGIVDEEAERAFEADVAAAELRAGGPTLRQSSGQASASAASWTDARAGVPSTGAQGRSAPHEPIEIMAQAESRIPGNLVMNLHIADIDKNPFQTRYVKSGEALEELTESIKANGVIQPIVVRPAQEEGRYVLVLGERRLHASKLAGKDVIPAIVRRVSEQQAAEMTIIENLQREDLSALEQAEAFRVLSEEFKLTQAQIGERVGLSRESVSNYMRLLKLPRTVMELLAEKKLKFAEARELLKLEDDQKIVEAALYAVKKGLTVEQVEMLVLRMNGWLDSIPGMPGLEKKTGRGARWVDPNVRAAQLELERLLGVRVRIRDRSGRGKITIEYSTVDDYERVVGMLRRK